MWARWFKISFIIKIQDMDSLDQGDGSGNWEK